VPGDDLVQVLAIFDGVGDMPPVGAFGPANGVFKDTLGLICSLSRPVSLRGVTIGRPPRCCGIALTNRLFYREDDFVKG